jgi:hypothetical protein
MKLSTNTHQAIFKSKGKKKMNIFKYQNGGFYVLTEKVNGKHIERKIMFGKYHNQNSNIKKEILKFKNYIKELKKK